MHQGQIEVPNDYFYKMSMMDYSKPHMALIREFFQNSVDAGTKKFDIILNKDEMTITFIDDGCGMTEDVILNRLLVMGGTFKQDDKSIGAFGHAKILIYFSWLEYSIQTQDLMVRGASNKYTIEKTDDFVNGTISHIKLRDEDDFNKIKHAIREFFSYCQTDVVVTHINIASGSETREEVAQKLVKVAPLAIQGSAIEVSMGEGLSSYESDYIYVRSNGVFMFRTWVQVLKSPIIAETTLSARDIFVQNRDSFKREYSEEYNQLQVTLTSNNISSTSIDYQKFVRAEVNKTDNRRKDAEKTEVYEYENSKFFCHGLTRNAIHSYMQKARSRRIRAFMEKFVDLYKEKRSRTEDLRCGFVFNPSVEGRFRSGNDEKIVFVNPNFLTPMIRNKKKFLHHLVLVLIHELAHSENLTDDGYMYHNEAFVNSVAEIQKVFWDMDEIHLLWKNTAIRGE